MQQDYLDRRKKPIESDHRKLCTSLDLFFLDPISPANPFFLPDGAYVYNKLIEFVRNLYEKYDYKEVITPQLFSTDLWKKSGHYDFYLENMYMMEIDENEVGVKPMNCPAHAIIFQSTLRSYRDLPLRLADFGRLHRYERSGATWRHMEKSIVVCSSREQHVVEVMNRDSSAVEVMDPTLYRMGTVALPYDDDGNTSRIRIGFIDGAWVALPTGRRQVNE